MALLLTGCGRAETPSTARDLDLDVPVTVLADSGDGGGLPPASRNAAPPPARVTLVRIAPERAGIAAPLPVPDSAAPDADPRGEGLVADDALRPPIPRGALELRVPGARRGVVELDVRVDERGEVTDVVVTGGDADSSARRAAVQAALRLRWFAATRRGRPVAVWSRQRFETGPAR